jgi:Predicted transcriptional regulator with C-terminal CBS domains
MDTAATLRDARHRAGLTQADLATRAGTSQATVSAYESGRKQPSVTTLSRLLAATGTQLTAEPAGYVVVQASKAELERRGRILSDVLDLAQSLPFRRSDDLRYPRLVR